MTLLCNVSIVPDPILVPDSILISLFRELLGHLDEVLSLLF